MIWHFYKIQDPIKHAEALAKSIAILRVIGTSPQGRARQAAFFQSKVLYTLVSSNIHSHLVKFSSSSAIHPDWGTHTGTVIHRVTKFPVFTDPQKFEAFCHLRFSPYDAHGLVELGLPDFMQHFDRSDYGHLTTALQGVALMFIAIGGVQWCLWNSWNP
jgi:hypothetical protein